MGNDVHGTGDHDHPGYGLVEGKVLVQESLHLPWRALYEGGRMERAKGKREREGKRERK